MRRGTRLEESAEHGLTVIELMIAVLLSAILSAGVFYMTAGQTRGYQTQLRSVTLQQNLWATMEYIQRQIFLAGYGFGGCPGGALKIWTGSGNDTSTLTMGMKVFNDCAFAHYTDGTAPVADTCPASSDGVDAFSVSYSTAAFDGDTPSVRIRESMPSSSANLKTTTCGEIVDGDIVALYQPGSNQPCTVMKVTKNHETGKGCDLQHHSDGVYNPPGGHNIFPPGGYDAGAMVVRIGSTSKPLKFAVDKSTDPPRLVQWREGKAVDLEVVANGIEDLQIAWACNYHNGGGMANPGVVGAGPGTDGVLYEGIDATSRKTDEWANNTPGDTAPSCAYVNTKIPGTCTAGSAPDDTCMLAPIAAVRITLIGRTPSAEPGDKGGFLQAAEDRAAGGLDTASNGGLGSYGRAVLSAVIKTRNMVR